MKRRHSTDSKPSRRPGSSLPYLMVALASVLFAAAQPSASVAPETVAVAVVDSWTGPSLP